MFKSGHQSTEFYKELWTTILSGKNWIGELLNKRKNGELYWINCLISPIADKTGQISHFVSVREDITERKKMVEDLIRAKERAEESEQLKTAFLQNLSHEVRTPLNAISGFSKLITGNNLNEEKKIQFSKIILNSSDQLINIITDLVEISQIQTNQTKLYVKEVEIVKFLDRLAQEFESKASEKNLSFYVSRHIGSNTVITTDKEKLLRIIGHLLDNAIKFTYQGKVEFLYRIENNLLQIEISDTGIGIMPEMQKLIFEPFRQIEKGTARNFGGNGLGLSLVNAYTQMLGGNIKLHSEPEKGTKITIHFPLKHA